MVESLLFGHRRGAFTGAVESTVGHVERSDKGTLFLDELESLTLEAQGKLLRVLETGEVQPLGAAGKRRVDLRVVSAMQDYSADGLESGRFRRDLFQRVAGVVIELPPLATRMEDVMPLADHFAGLQSRRLEPGCERVLLNYSWPGNVRELRLAIERAGELVEDGTLPCTALATAMELGACRPGPQRAEQVAQSLIEAGAGKLLNLCAAHGWQAQRIAEALGIHRTTLHRRLRVLGVSLRRMKMSHDVAARSRDIARQCDLHGFRFPP